MGSATVDTRDTQEFDARCASWIQQMSTGSEDALGDLYEATLSRVFGVAVRIVGDSDMSLKTLQRRCTTKPGSKAGQYDAAPWAAVNVVVGDLSQPGAGRVSSYGLSLTHGGICGGARGGG